MSWEFQPDTMNATFLVPSTTLVTEMAIFNSRVQLRAGIILVGSS